MNILETNHLTFNYRNHSVLEDINLKIPEGSIYGYLGKNGEGKSTFRIGANPKKYGIFQ